MQKKGSTQLCISFCATMTQIINQFELVFMQSLLSSSPDALIPGYAKACLELDSVLFSLVAASGNSKSP